MNVLECRPHVLKMCRCLRTCIAIAAFVASAFCVTVLITVLDEDGLGTVGRGFDTPLKIVTNAHTIQKDESLEFEQNGI